MRVLKFLLVSSSMLGAAWWSIDAVCAAQDSETAPSAWPQFRGNPQLTGVAGSTVPREPKLLWTYDAGESIDSSAAIADGTVYVGTHAGEPAGDRSRDR